MHRPAEPVWPTLTTPQRGDDHGYAAGVRDSIAAWRASVDDPAADLPGTVRISLGGIVAVRREDGGLANPWVSLIGSGGQWFRNDEVAGWTIGTPVEGTPAAKAQTNCSDLECVASGRFHLCDTHAPAAKAAEQ